eukprot:TRINITY_DN31650_c0_g1_i1.p1 TRINITY_DN31650_c0_g1~~TRINITY_DN31650_c0_g1_i1.p1  ORF type:complete len:113 (+),score=5.81 TRINITY_DN31650_c0_g1_i1:380-718(+)
MGPPHKRPLEVEARGSPAEHPSANSESPRKRYKQDEMPDSPESGDMVIDESARPDSAHSHKTNSPLQMLTPPTSLLVTEGALHPGPPLPPDKVHAPTSEPRGPRRLRTPVRR